MHLQVNMTSNDKGFQSRPVVCMQTYSADFIQNKIRKKQTNEIYFGLEMLKKLLCRKNARLFECEIHLMINVRLSVLIIKTAFLLQY